MNDAAIPLCLDFDGTLTSTSARLEQLFWIAKHEPREFVPVLRLGSSTAKFWLDIASRADMGITALPLRRELLAWLKLERAAGRHLILLVDGDRTTADEVAALLPLFDQCEPLDGGDGSLSERRHRTLVNHFGERGFDYVGGDPADAAVWPAARRAIVIGNSALAERVSRVSDVAQVFPASKASVRAWVKAIRLHQWVKNTLVFLPAILAHAILIPQVLRDTVLAFIAFGLCASSVYLLNDLFDLAADRVHARKRFRPLAAGTISPRAGLVGSLLLLLVAASIALSVNLNFAAVLSGYYVLTWAYSVRLKRIALLDVMTLATLYTVRIIAGAAASDVPLSFWLLAFSVFIFLSLGFVKRYAELEANRRAEQPDSSSRAYRASDLPVIMSLGTASGYSAIVVIALYINSPDSLALYHRHRLLWLICPLMLSWISRAWMRTARGRMHDDPVVFAVSDWVSLVTIGLVVAIVALAV
jgi:4-hydroxybenzoate polyprenyltransferase